MRRGERAAGAMRISRVDARRRKLRETVAVEEQVDDLVAGRVPALHDDRALGAMRLDPPRRGAGIGKAVDPRCRESDLGFGDVRRHHERARQAARPACARTPSSSSERVAALGDHDRIDDDQRQIELARSRRATASTIAAVASMPVLVAWISMSPATASICAVTRSAATAATAVTPTVFWAVIAVMALVPYTPSAANVFRSA